MWPNPQETADLGTYTDEILNGKLRFLCSVNIEIYCLFCKTLLCKERYKEIDISVFSCTQWQEIRLFFLCRETFGKNTHKIFVFCCFICRLFNQYSQLRIAGQYRNKIWARVFPASLNAQKCNRKVHLKEQRGSFSTHFEVPLKRIQTKFFGVLVINWQWTWWVESCR